MKRAHQHEDICSMLLSYPMTFAQAAPDWEDERSMILKDGASYWCASTDFPSKVGIESRDHRNADGPRYDRA